MSMLLHKHARVRPTTVDKKEGCCCSSSTTGNQGGPWSVKNGVLVIVIFLKVFNISDIPDGCVLCDDVIEQKQQIASYTVFISYLCKG
jgi:hypothetical protein